MKNDRNILRNRTTQWRHVKSNIKIRKCELRFTKIREPRKPQKLFDITILDENFKVYRTSYSQSTLARPNTGLNHITSNVRVRGQQTTCNRRTHITNNDLFIFKNVNEQLRSNLLYASLPSGLPTYTHCGKAARFFNRWKHLNDDVLLLSWYGWLIPVGWYISLAM